MTRRWWWRGASSLLLLGAVAVVLRLLRIEPDPLRLTLGVLLVVAVGWLVADTLALDAPSWQVSGREAGWSAGGDARLTTHTRVLEDHLAARDPGPALRDRLAALAAQRLALHHGLSLADLRASELLGADVVDALTGPVRRLQRAEVDRCLSRIEEL